MNEVTIPLHLLTPDPWGIVATTSGYPSIVGDGVENPNDTKRRKSGLNCSVANCVYKPYSASVLYKKAEAEEGA